MRGHWLDLIRDRPAYLFCEPSFREGLKDQTSDAQLRIGESPDSMLRIAPE
jgi:hypothetical protein